MVTTNKKKFADFLRIFRNQGQEGRYNHTYVGNNYRPTDYAAAIGKVQLKKIESVLIEKNKIAKIYNKAFKNINLVETPYLPNYVTRHTWYMYCLTFSDKINLINKRLINKKYDTDLFSPIICNSFKKFGYKKVRSSE